MKKILFIAALTLSVVSCDMDKMPYDAIPDTEALVTPSDFANMRVGLYSGMRSSIGGDAFYNSTEIQCDGFHAVVGYSNTLGDMYRWTHT
ncbi:MAG: RagB/SusD family nutrient uptake outer membrane protein, partial [Prevotella sp.]|nr:RagB/SusD family nutrient uptake outer membrane protein [Prevotella sp.]